MKNRKSRNWGECYYDHYEAYLGKPHSHSIFRLSEEEPVIQIAEFENIFGGCRAFCSLGLSHYSQEVCGIAEMIMIADDGWDDIPSLLANTLFAKVTQRKHLRSGIAIEGFEQFLPDFSRKFDKSGVYITNPFGLSEEFNTVQCGSEIGRIYMGFCISAAECAYYVQHDADAFESLLEQKEVDIFNLGRQSCLP